MSAGEPSTAAETLNNTVNARKSILGSQVTTDASQMIKNGTDTQISFVRGGPEALRPAKLESGTMTPNSFSKRQSKSFLKQDTGTASTMNNTL